MRVKILCCFVRSADIYLFSIIVHCAVPIADLRKLFQTKVLLWVNSICFGIIMVWLAVWFDATIAFQNLKRFYKIPRWTFLLVCKNILLLKIGLRKQSPVNLAFRRICTSGLPMLKYGYMIFEVAKTNNLFYLNFLFRNHFFYRLFLQQLWSPVTTQS